MTKPFTYEVMRGEWIAEVGKIDCYGDPNSFQPYWRSEPFPDRESAIAALEEHEDVVGYSKQLMRYKMKKSYTHGQFRFRWTKVDEYAR